LLDLINQAQDIKRAHGKGTFLRYAKQNIELICMYKISERNIGLLVSERKSQFNDVFNSAKEITPIRPKILNDEKLIG